MKINPALKIRKRYIALILMSAAALWLLYSFRPEYFIGKQNIKAINNEPVNVEINISSDDIIKEKARSLSIKTANGDVIDFTIELALTAEEKAKGLMFRKNLPDNSGMLLLFEEEQFVNMWMKNTFIPLDMIFIDKKGYIIKIHKNATPISHRSIPSDGKILAVLEINGGISDNFNINIGDKVLHPFFENIE